MYAHCHNSCVRNVHQDHLVRPMRSAVPVVADQLPVKSKHHLSQANIQRSVAHCTDDFIPSAVNQSASQSELTGLSHLNPYVHQLVKTGER